MINTMKQQIAEQVEPFVQLGLSLKAFGEGEPWPGHGIGLTETEYEAFDRAIEQAHLHNSWFTPGEVRHAVAGLARMLAEDHLQEWLERYPALQDQRPPRSIGIIMAGNVPLVGFHDMLCTLVCGHRARIKTASGDAGLTKALRNLLVALEPQWAERVHIMEDKLGEVDAIIATGSNNTARYFTHYFGHLPHIIRRNRTSMAVLNGKETEEELAALGEDVFRYFGMGCRNVGKVLIPHDFELDRLFRSFFRWKGIINHHKYANNYDYNRAIWLLDRAPVTENGFLIMKEDSALHSPVAALYYQRYQQPEEVAAYISRHEAELQCIVGHGHLPFGTAQRPGLSDYADQVDTMAFLLGATEPAG